jgi:hypothetical protein
MKKNGTAKGTKAAVAAAKKRIGKRDRVAESIAKSEASVAKIAAARRRDPKPATNADAAKILADVPAASKPAKDRTANDVWRALTQACRKLGWSHEGGAGLRASLVAFAEKNGLPVPERKRVLSAETIAARVAAAPAEPAKPKAKVETVRAPKASRRSKKAVAK